MISTREPQCVDFDRLVQAALCGQVSRQQPSPRVRKALLRAVLKNHPRASLHALAEHWVSCLLGVRQVKRAEWQRSRLAADRSKASGLLQAQMLRVRMVM
jgi:hypothetical protein